MSRYASIRVRGIVKPEFRRQSFLKVAYNGKWDATKTKSFRRFGREVYNASTIPCGDCYFPDNWDGCDKEDMEFETKFDIETGFWQFATSFNIQHSSILYEFRELTKIIFEHLDVYDIAIENFSEEEYFSCMTDTILIDEVNKRRNKE